MCSHSLYLLMVNHYERELEGWFVCGLFFVVGLLFDVHCIMEKKSIVPRSDMDVVSHDFVMRLLPLTTKTVLNLREENSLIC